MDRSKQLGEESIGRLLLKFSIPAIVGMVVNAAYNVVDRAFVGWGVSHIAISAITLTFPISLIIMAFGMLIGIGASASISIKLGQQKKKEAEHILGNAFILLVIVSVSVTVIGIVFMGPLLRLFGASAEVLPMARQFITIILFGAVLQNIGFGLNNIIRAEGNPKMAMATMLIGVFLNFILNPTFIFIMHLGIRGSALATIISQTVCSVWVLRYFKSSHSILKLKAENFKLEHHIVRQIFAIGLSPFLMQIAASVVTVILNNSLVAYGGDIAVAAMGIINAISMLILMPIFGINQGVQPVLGYNYGALKFDRVKKALLLAILAATVISTTGFIIIESIPRLIIGIFGKSDIELMNIGVRGMRIFLCMLPIIGFQIVGTVYFQAVGKAKISIILSLSRQVIVLLPLILFLPRIFKLDGVWMAGPSADFISSVLTAIFLFLELKKLDSKHAEQKIGDVS